MPIAMVLKPMIRSVTRNACLRPTRSPMRPKKIAPKGRTTNPGAKVARVESSATVGLPWGKKLLARIVARLPKM